MGVVYPIRFFRICANRQSLTEEPAVIIFDEAKRSVAIERGNVDADRMDGGFRAACAESVRGRHRSSDHIPMSVGERWKASISHACILAPYAAALILRAAGLPPFNRGCSLMNKGCVCTF
jgi:hypothetical protein